LSGIIFISAATLKTKFRLFQRFRPPFAPEYFSAEERANFGGQIRLCKFLWFFCFSPGIFFK